MEALINNMIKAIGWSIFHSLWQGAVLYAALTLLFLMIPKHRAKLKHNMAYITMSLMFTGFCVTFFSLFTWPPIKSVPEGLSLNSVVSLNHSIAAEKYFPMLAAVYGTGLLLQLVILITGYRKTWKIKQAAQIRVPSAWQELFLQTASNMKIHKKVGFYLSDYVSVPLVVGFFKPVVLFPMAFATQLDMVHLEAILIHELAHIRRNDYFLNILKTVMETILFFNPFAWLCSNHIEREREHACDDLVLKQTQTPLTYAHALLQIELLKQKHTPVFSMAASGNNQHLYQRIKRITDMKTNYNMAKQQLIAVGIAILTLVSLAWINPAEPQPIVKRKTLLISKTEQVSSREVVTSLQDSIKKKKVKVAPKAPAPPKQPRPVSKKSARLAIPPMPPVPPLEPEEVARMSQEFQKTFDSPEWKKHQEELKKHALAISNEVNSAEFKRGIAEIKKQSAELTKHFNSAEWKKQMAELKKQSVEMARMQNKNNIYQSDEFKALQTQFHKDVEMLKLKKQQEAEKN